MRLVRLIYANTFKSKTVDASELSRIHEKAKTANLSLDIAGMLVFGNDFFLQCLEGGREAVNSLYSKIASDPRHERSLLLEYSELTEKDFDQWSMKLVLLTPEKMKFLRKFSATSTFDPYKMRGKSGHQLMLSLRCND